MSDKGFMTQVVVMQRQTPKPSCVLDESEAKKPHSSSSNLSWTDFAGLPWLTMKNFNNNNMGKIQ